MNIANLGDHALELTVRGFRIGPLHTPDPDHPCGCSCRRNGCESEGKHPRSLNGVHGFTRDSKQIQKWWRMWPDANVGVACGDGLVVLDVDPRHGGDDSLVELEEAHGEIITLTVRTGGGGLHLYLAGNLPARNAFRPGLDLKATGGYVVAPPSFHASGRRYEWIHAEEGIRVAPTWLVEVVKPKKVESRDPGPPREGDVSPRYIAAAIEAECLELAGTAPGNRNNRLNSAAFSLARFVAGGQAEATPIIEALTLAAKEAGLPDWETQRTISSAFNAREVAA